MIFKLKIKKDEEINAIYKQKKGSKLCKKGLIEAGNEIPVEVPDGNSLFILAYKEKDDIDEKTHSSLTIELDDKDIENWGIKKIEISNSNGNWKLKDIEIKKIKEPGGHFCGNGDEPPVNVEIGPPK